MSTPVRINYLNNRDLLAEIHRSKLSFCYFLEDKYQHYDIIVSSVDDIKNSIEAARAKIANKMTQSQKVKPGEQRVQIQPEDIRVEDIVWRVMTYEHIPLDPNRSKNPKTEAEKHRKTNFPPFKHYILEGEDAVEVGRSHWVDGFANGRFCQDQGAINNRLARMFMTLVDRYSQRGNWRGYCIPITDEALTQRGWLKGDEINENDMIMSYSEGQMKWSKVKSVFRDHFEGLMHKLDMPGMDMMMTPGHKLVTEQGLVPVEYLTAKDRIILMGRPIEDPVMSEFGDAYVELIGWIGSKGTYESENITISETSTKFADRIRNCLYRLFMKFTESQEKSKICFTLSQIDSKRIKEILPTNNLTMNFIMKLSHFQRELLLNTMIASNGWATGFYLRYGQSDDKNMNMLQALCALSGRRTIWNKRHDEFDSHKYIHDLSVLKADKKKSRVDRIDFHGGRNHIGPGGFRNKVYRPNQPTAYYKGEVWCPETEYGCFLTRRNGTVYLTGNTYVSEMRGQALLQLSLVGLQFDEGRSENPFAYFTVVTGNAFTRVLNLEKRNQNIRDDILIMNGVSPSITRQLDDHLQQKATIASETGGDAIPVQMSEIKARSNRMMFGRPYTKK